MKKIIFFLFFLFSFSSLFSNTYERVESPYTGDCIPFSDVTRTVNAGTCTYTDSDNQFLALITIPDQFTYVSSTSCQNPSKILTSSGSCECPEGKVWNSSTETCDCPSGFESVSLASCPPNLPDPLSCKLPCPEGQTRNSAGGCCPTGLDVFCNGTSWTGCQCPEGTDMIQNSDGTWSCPTSCPDGYERGIDTECYPICDLCQNAQQEAQTICTNANAHLLDYNCTSNPSCTNRDFSVSCGDQPTCNECEDRLSTRQSECLTFGAYLTDFQCSEDTTTCEVTTYNAGQCIDDDQNPLDPNYGDGSQDNNDNTNDIPDINNTATETTDANGNTQIELPDYNPAFEAIGDNIEDQTKATNAQTRANKQNTEFLGGKLDKIIENTDSIKDINDKLDLGADDVESDTSDYENFIANASADLASAHSIFENLKSTISGDPITISSNVGVNPEFTTTVFGKEIKISLCETFSLFKPIFSFIFTIVFLILAIQIFIAGFKVVTK